MSDSNITNKALPRRRFFSDMPDKGLFVAVALGGFVGICLLKINGSNATLVTLVAVGTMIAYGSIAFHMPLVQMRLDRLGDNFYYLGFIFTLASLTAALIEFSGGTDVKPLLESFGIALATTILGIAGRVVFVQLRSNLDDIEEKELGETWRRHLQSCAVSWGNLFVNLRRFEPPYRRFFPS